MIITFTVDTRLRYAEDPILVGDSVLMQDGQLGKIIAKRKVGLRYYLVIAPEVMIDEKELEKKIMMGHY